MGLIKGDARSLEYCSYWVEGLKVNRVFGLLEHLEGSRS